ncbi:MAG: hypothetical protein HYY82_12295 [Deltaproteobacteria bacterium]|nr:hypothetical protein [Deltaproteobacteria bacterium]
MPVNIPEGITLTEFSAIAGLLTNIRTAVGASQVSVRLNESQRNGGEPGIGSPFFDFSYFVGSVQDADTENARKALYMPDPGLYRFGDNVTSKETREAIAKAVTGNPNDLFARRGWPSTTSTQKKGMGSKGMGRESGLQLQVYIGIKISGRCVGTLGVSFKNTPTNIPAVESQIIGWARDPGYPPTLINYLSNTFNLSGPTCP